MSINIHPNRIRMPQTGEQLELKLNEPKCIILDNGIKTYIINEGKEEFSRFDFVFNAGSSLQTKNLVANSTIQLLTEGTKNLSSNEIAKKLDYHGAIVDTTLSKDYSGLTLYSLNKYLPELLPFISDMITNPSFLEDELTNYLQIKKNQFLLNNNKVRYKAMLEFNKMVFGSNSAYGKVVKSEDYNNVVRDDLIEFFNNHFTPQDTYIIISGNIKNKTISLVNKYFGNSLKTNKPAKVTAVNIINEVEELNRFVKKEGTLQSAIRVGKPIINKQHSDYNSLIVLNTILGGYFGSRLMSNLREDKGYTYGVSSYIINYKHAGFFSIATEVNAKQSNAALDEIKTEIEKLCTTKISSKEINLVKNYIYGSYLRSFDGPMALAERFRSAKDLDLNFKYYSRSLNEMMKQTPQQLLETANKYFNFDEMIKLVVGEMKIN